MHEIVVTRDIEYAQTSGHVLRLDLYRPETAVAPPAVVYLHGGAWAVGDKSEGAEGRLAALASHGISVASVNYRLIPDGARYPDPIHDAKAAVRWLRSRGADHGLAIERIGVWGASAGGYLAAMVGLTSQDAAFEGEVGDALGVSSAVDAVVDWFGQSDLVENARRSDLERAILSPPVEPPLFGVDSIKGLEEDVRAASPLAHVSPAAPPFLIVHGDRDRVTPTAESEALHAALVRAGVPSTYLVLGGAGHEGAEFDAPGHIAMTAAFLRTHLQPCVTDGDH